MDSVEIKEYLMNSLCRICAEKSSKLIPILEIKLLPLKICKCLPIKVTAGDDLPVNICEMCLLKIDESYLLYQTCYYADQRLKKLWKTLINQTITPESFLNEAESRGNLIEEGDYESEYVVDDSRKGVNDEFVADKKVPVSVILVNETVMVEETLNNPEYVCKTGDVLMPSDIILNEAGSEYNDFNVLVPTDDQAPSFLTDNTRKDNLQESVILFNGRTKCHAENVNFTGEELVQENTIVNSNDQDANEVEEKVYECKYCSLQLFTLSSLNEHESTHSQDKPFLCDTCGKSFMHANNLKNHVKIHSAYRKKYSCNICNKSFFTNFFLQEHMNTHTGETPYKCQVCGKEFREKVHLRQHKWTHSSEKFLCPVCGNHFNRKGNMMEHIKKYHSSNEDATGCKKSICVKFQKKKKAKEAKKGGELRFTCSICKKGFSSQVLLKNHNRHHGNKELHFCSLCGKKFRHSGSLTYHRRTAHTGEKPFQCSYCDERFSLRSVQKIHERKKHTFENPYKCPFCTRSFYNSSSLKNHSYVHMKEKTFECDVCGKKFSRNSNLFVHKKIHSDDRQYTCEQCGKSYIQKHDMIKHQKVHDPKSKPFFCKYCANSFAHKKDFARHAICHFDHIRKSNCDIGAAEKFLEIVEGDLTKNSKTLFDAEQLILETSDELPEERLEKTEFA